MRTSPSPLRLRRVVPAAVAVVAMLGLDQAVDLLASTVVASIGPVTAEAAQQLNIATNVMPRRYTIPDLVDALVEHFATAAAEPKH